MKLTDEQKDLLTSLAVGLLNMILFVLLMGTMAIWGQSAGHKIRTKITSHPHQQPAGSGDPTAEAAADSLKDS
jgi:hypothetical protein